MTVLGLMVAAFLLVGVIWLPALLETASGGLACSGSVCLDGLENAGWQLFSALFAALVVMVAGGWVVIVRNPGNRAEIRHGVLVLALVLGCLSVVWGFAPLMALLTGPFALVHAAATVLLIIGLSRHSRKMTLTASIVGVAGLAGTLYSPQVAALDAAASAAFALVCLSLVIPGGEPVAEKVTQTAPTAEAMPVIFTVPVVSTVPLAPPPFDAEPRRATPRRQWITVTALMPIVLIFASLTGFIFPVISDVYRLSCSGEGDSYTCPDNKAYIAGALYSGGIIMAGVLVLCLLGVILAARRQERSSLARDLQLMAVVVACVPIPLAARLLFYGYGWEYFVTSALHVSATVLLIVALSRRSRILAISACVLGVAAVVGPLFSWSFGAVQIATATWFFIAFCATVAPQTPQSEPSVGDASVSDDGDVTTRPQ